MGYDNKCINKTPFLLMWIGNTYLLFMYYVFMYWCKFLDHVSGSCKVYAATAVDNNNQHHMNNSVRIQTCLCLAWAKKYLPINQGLVYSVLNSVDHIFTQICNPLIKINYHAASSQVSVMISGRFHLRNQAAHIAYCIILVIHRW